LSIIVTLSFGAYLKFIEDDFTSSRRIDPKTDAARIADKRANSPADDCFDFSQKPREPKLLPLHPKTTLKSTPPLAPLITKITASGPGQVTLVWDIPPSDGGAPILHYLVTPYRNGVAEAAHTYPVNDPYVYTDVINGLTPGATYPFPVRAVNKLGAGTAVKSSAVTVG
jgi:hypothetical protein